MTKVIILILFPFILISDTVTVNVARDDGKSFSTIHIRANNAIQCKKFVNNNFKDEVECSFDNSVEHQIKNIENLYFKINASSNKFSVVSKYKAKLYAMPDNFISTDKVLVEESGSYKHWIVLGYQEELDLFSENQNIDLNFPIEFKKNKTPIVGALDLDEVPLPINKNAKTFARLKTAFKNKNYDLAVGYVDKLMNDDDKTFYNDAKLYKIRILNALILQDDLSVDPEELIINAEEWLKENPSEIDIPEVLYTMSNAYLFRGRMSKAEGVIDLLESEYENNYFTDKAKLNYAQNLLDKKKYIEAKSQFEKIFYNTSHIEIASAAAAKLARINLDNKKVKIAQEFYTKVLNANKKYIDEHIIDSYQFAKDFADLNDTNTSLHVASVFSSEEIDKYLDREELEKNIAYWYENHNRDLAIQLYQKYLEKYQNGTFRDFVQKRLDMLLLDVIDGNSTIKLNYYDELLQKYPDRTIQQKAILKKAELLVADKRYDEILEMKDILKEYGGESFLSQVAEVKTKQALSQTDCSIAMSLVNEYNLSIESFDQQKLFDCMMRTSRYKEANALCDKELKSSLLSDNLPWLYNKTKALNMLEKYQDAIKSAHDVEKISALLNNTQYKDILYEKAKAYYFTRNENGNQFLDTVVNIEKVFLDDIRNLDLFDRVVRFAKERRDDMMTLQYTKKMIDFQEKYQIDTYSPRVDIDYISALKNMGKYQEALDAVLKLLYKNLTDQQKANVLYLAGEISLKLNKTEEAKEFFIKCGKIVEDNAWQKLCSESLFIIE
jgi:tetratricopeptide (TPR) repeat protein